MLTIEAIHTHGAVRARSQGKQHVCTHADTHNQTRTHKKELCVHFQRFALYFPDKNLQEESMMLELTGA